MLGPERQDRRAHSGRAFAKIHPGWNLTFAMKKSERKKLRKESQKEPHEESEKELQRPMVEAED